MRTTPLVCLLLIVAARAAPAPPAATRLEDLVSSADTVIVRSQEIGSLRAPDATATVIAIAARAGAQPPLRGARFDLTSNAGTDRIYLDGNQLNRLRNELDLMVRFGTTASLAGPATSAAQGTESCWMPNPALRILCPEIRVSPEWAGISLSAFGGPGFAFRGVEARELLQLVDRAIAELDAR